MGSDPAKKQYFLFSLVVSILFAFALNFVATPVVEAVSTFGYPLSTADASGAGKTLVQIVNSVTMGAMLSVPFYYVIFWLLNKR